MAGKNIQVNLQFNANVQNAKAQLQSLQNQLNTLINSNTTSTLGITPQIQEATRSAMDLKIALNNATNVDTGKLNLNKFQSELNRSGKSIQQYAQQMKMLGPEGVKAFTQVANAVAQADTRLFSLQGGMKKLANTFMNTVRWQVTSQAIMAVTSAVTETIDYAKELDTSLNNIRIVTGKSADQMATFAKQANNAAKALSTSTTKYTDASLIYYQQGLNDKAVKERTDVTVKLANVVGKSAETVSEWMTAIWNNFDNGSEKLEYYADVLAKLGAATASSADEIAGGLEKFAAVADTIGLSYEYAASALATITAETRQSEDVVGTALKTILSRMEQLKLGENLDDGTTLGQYSLALKTVGVNIQEANGELKDMDVILQQTGTRWETLARDEQIALAQSVAGIRQYTQFMALMDNWDVMKKNLELTEQANGALSEQQKIYEESTKAAEERMKVAAEALKTTLLGGEDLNKFYDFGAGALEVINELLEAFGGLPTILLAVAAALTKVYQPQVASFISQAAIAGKDLGMAMLHPVKAMKGENVYSSQQIRLDTLQAAKDANAGLNSGQSTVSNKLLDAEFEAQTAIIKNENKINASAKQKMEWQIQYLDKKKEELMLLEEINAKNEKANAKNIEKLGNLGIGSQDINSLTTKGTQAGKLAANTNLLAAKVGQVAHSDVNSLGASDKAQLGNSLGNNLEAIKKSAGELGIELNQVSNKGFKQIEDAIEQLKNNGTIDIEELLNKIKQLQEQLGTIQGGAPGAIGQTLGAATGNLKADILQEEIDKMPGGNVTDADKMFAGVNTIDTDKFSNNKFKSQDADLSKYDGKSHKNVIKSFKDQAKALKDQKKLLLDQQKGLDKSSKKYQDLQTKINDNKKATSQLGKEMTKFKKNLNSTTAINEEYGKTIDDTTKSSQDLASGTEVVGEGVKDIEQGFQDVEDAANNGGQGFTHWSDTLASGVSNMATYAMGLSMLTSAFENLFNAIGSGDITMGDVISSLSSILMSTSMLIPVIISATNAYKAKKLAQQEEAKQTLINKLATEGVMSAEQAEIAVSKLAQKESHNEARAELVEAGAETISGFGGIADQVGQGPKGWVTAAISAAMIAPIAVMTLGSAISGFSGGSKEAKEEEVSKGTESLEAINENQELAESVTDLTEEYNALRNAGESTADVLEDMREKIPELIDSYKELAKTMGTHIDTSELEKAYEVFEKTGDTSLLEKAQEKLDKDIKSKEKTIAQSTIDNASDLVMDAAFEGQGHKDGKSYTYHMGDVGLSDEKEKQVQNIFAEELNDLWKKDSDGAGGQFTISDYENEGELIDAYNKMLAARDRLVEAGLDDTNYYKELNGEIKQMAKSMPDLINAQQQLFDIQKEEALKDEQAFNSKIGLSSIGSIEEFETNKDKLIKKIQEETEWTAAQAEAYLAATEAYGGYAEAADFFSESGLGFNKDASEQSIKEIKDWFSKLPEEERTLAMTIDYTTVGSVEEAKTALEEARKKAEEAKILQEVEALKVDSAVFETYVEGLAEVNKGLDKNSNLTKQVALNNLKISKGLETLTKNWDKNLEIIQSGNKASFEYAKAIGEVKTAFEEMFGVKPSTDYIEKYSQQINAMVNGNLDSLQQLQDALAEDYIMNMEFSTPTNEEWSGTIAEAQNQLRGLLDDIDTSIEIGKESEISSDFLESVQNMLDAGIIAEDQLESLFRAKGYELNITGWKHMPGPKKKITQTTYDPNNPEKKTTKVIEEQEDIQVPIINGKTDGLSVSGTPSVATITKSTDKKVIDTSAARDKADKAQDRKDSLKYELDRYHEINEIISDTKRELDKLSKAKDRAYGANKLALMDKEIAKQKELIKNNKKLLEEAEKYYAQDRVDLLNNYAVKLDSTGRISNYEEIQQWYVDQLNKSAGNETQYTKIEEQYEKFKDAAKKYEESLNKVEEQAEKVNDELDALYEKNLEKIEYKVQIKVDIADDDKAYLDFLMQKIEDDAFAAAEAIGYLGEKAQLTLDKIKANEEGIAEIERALAAGEITPEQAVEKMRKYRDELVVLNADLLKIRQTVQDKLTEAFEGWNEEIERGITKLKHYGSVLENYKNIINIVGKDMLGISDETMSNLSKVQIANANNIIRATKAQLDTNNSTLERMRQARAEAEARGDEESVKEWNEQIKVAEEKSQELATTLQEALSNGLQLAADDFALTVEQIADSFSKAVSGIYNDIEDMRDGWDRMQEVADRYLETYEKTYEISKLNRKIQDSIDKTDNIASQKELRNLQNEMYEMTKDGQQLSKYDLEYLQKKYDLMVAEQAFKDAQNAKSVVRLQRDSEGNFGYVYTADQGAVDNAEQNYEDKLYAFQEYTHKMDEELAEMYISVQEQAYERMQAAAELYGEGTEAFERERQKILEQYNIDMGYITDEYEKLTGRNLEINQRFNAGVAETYEQTFINSIVPQYQSFEQLYDETTTQCEASCTRLDEAITLLQQTFDKQLELAGQDLEGFEKTANEELEKVQVDSSTTAEKVEDMADRMNTALNGSGGAIKAVEGFQIAYSDQMETVRNATDLTIQKVNNLIQEYAKLAEAAGMDYTPPNNSGPGTYVNPVGDGSSGEKKIGNDDTELSLKRYKVTNIDYGGSAGTRYQLEDGKWYSASNLSLTSDQQHREHIGMTVSEDKISGGQKELYDTIPLTNASLTVNDSEDIRRYDKDGTGGTLFYGALGKDNLKDLQKLSIIGYKYDKNSNTNLYKLSGGFNWGSANKTTYWLNQTDLHQLLNKAGEKALSKQYNLKLFDTGGYTGNWGPEGRLAMLHQKEIVLNAHDTENFLAAIGIVRDISDQIEKNAIVMQYQNQLANYRASVGNSGETLQQEVHITAEFPNATDHNEIEEAFKNLTNLASQYANRKF